MQWFIGWIHIDVEKSADGVRVTLINEEIKQQQADAMLTTGLFQVLNEDQIVKRQLTPAPVEPATATEAAQPAPAVDVISEDDINAELMRNLGG